MRGVRTLLNGAPVRARGKEALGEAMLYATTPHMFGSGYEAAAFGAVRDAVKRPLYGCDCYAYGLVASGFGADLVVEADLGLSQRGTSSREKQSTNFRSFRAQASG